MLIFSCAGATPTINAKNTTAKLPIVRFMFPSCCNAFCHLTTRFIASDRSVDENSSVCACTLRITSLQVNHILLQMFLHSLQQNLLNPDRGNFLTRSGSPVAGRYWIFFVASVQYGSRSFFFSIFPEPVLGSTRIKSIDFGDLYLAIRSLQKVISSSSVALHAGFKTTIPLTASPHFSSGTPTTAHSRTAGCM